MATKLAEPANRRPVIGGKLLVLRGDATHENAVNPESSKTSIDLRACLEGSTDPAKTAFLSQTLSDLRG